MPLRSLLEVPKPPEVETLIGDGDGQDTIPEVELHPGDHHPSRLIGGNEAKVANRSLRQLDLVHPKLGGAFAGLYRRGRGRPATGTFRPRSDR